MYSLAQRTAKSCDSMTGAVRFTSILPILFVLAVSLGPAQAAEDAKWFVLRHDQTGDCWTALLIEINGDYRHEFAQKAGGPYDTKAEALRREKDLEQKGTCNRTNQQ